jgi:hypothetical protein
MTMKLWDIFKVLVSLLFVGGVITYTVMNISDHDLIQEKGRKCEAVIDVEGGRAFLLLNIEGRTLTMNLSLPHRTMRDGEKYQAYYYDEIPINSTYALTNRSLTLSISIPLPLRL